MRFISLFAGIGGLDLGLERAGMECVAQVEINPYARRVLAKHWPEVPRYDDIRTVGKQNLPECDLICGGFPCQDLSHAGKGAGIDAERSGLWREYHRVIRELRPDYVLVENVSALLGRGLSRVLGDLAASGYDAEWSMLSACALGAPHMRKRLFIVAYPNSLRQRQTSEQRPEQHAVFHGPVQDGQSRKDWWRDTQPDRRNAPQPELYGMVDGVPDRVDRIKGCGNAVVPQVAEFIGRRIVAHATT